MSNEALTWAFKQDIPSSSAKFVLVVLADHADEAWSCFPSQRKIARMTGLAERSVRRWLEWLEQGKYIARHQRRGEGGRRTTDRYRILQERPETTGQADRLTGESQATTGGQNVHRPDMPVGQSANPTAGHNGRLQDPQAGTTGQSGYRPDMQPQPAQLAGQEPSVEPSLPVSHESGQAAALTPIPADFTPTDQMRAWASQRVPGVDADFQTEQFVDYWLARGDHRADWGAAWRQWMRNQHKWAAGRQGGERSRAPAGDHRPYRNVDSSVPPEAASDDPWA